MTDRSSTQNISKDTEQANTTQPTGSDIYWTLHPTTARYYTYLFSGRIKHLLRMTIFWAIKWVSVNLKGLESCRSWEKSPKHVETKHASKQPMGQRRNQKENYKGLWLNENKTTHENLENATKVVLSNKFTALNV